MVVSFRHLPGFLPKESQAVLLREIRQVLVQAPLFAPTMPRTGQPFGVIMSNCGPLGWVSDAAGGYRYQPAHPVTEQAWPDMPAVLLKVWRDVTKYHVPPEACLINYYRPGAKMGSHVDRDEADKRAPVLSISLGDTAVFHVGGTTRTSPKERVQLASGDVLVLEGPSRFAYHGIDRVIAGSSALLAEGGRINLTLRRVTSAA